MFSSLGYATLSSVSSGDALSINRTAECKIVKVLIDRKKITYHFQIQLACINFYNLGVKTHFPLIFS